MANEIKWSTTLGTYTTLIAGAASAPTLKNLANNAQKLGNEIAGNRNRYCALELKCRFQVAPNTYGVVEVYFVPAVDNTQFADGDDSVAPGSIIRAASFPLRAVTTQQWLAECFVMLPPFDFKPLVINKSGQAMTNTDNENILSYRTYNEEVQ